MLITLFKHGLINHIVVHNLFINNSEVIHISTEFLWINVTHNSSTGKIQSYPQDYTLHTLDSLDKFLDDIIEFHIFVAFAADLVMGVDNCCMIASTKHFTDARQRCIGELAA